MEGLKAALSWLWKQRWKFSLMVSSTMIFLFLLFPLNDLNDLISAQVSQASGNQVYLQFEQMKMSVFPQPGVAMEEVFVEGQNMPPLKAQEVIFTPSVMSLLTQKPAGTVTANGFMKGNVEISLSPGGKSENGVVKQKITLNAKQISLQELKNLAPMPVNLKGSLDASSVATLDFNFKEQPDADLNLKLNRPEVLALTLQTLMGPYTLPDLKFTSVELKGRLSAGKFLIEDGTIGKDNDELHGKVKGSIDMVIAPIPEMGNQIGTRLGGYDLSIEVSMNKNFQTKLGPMVGLLDQYKTVTPTGATYRIKVSGSSFQVPPSISALR